MRFVDCVLATLNSHAQGSLRPSLPGGKSATNPHPQVLLLSCKRTIAKVNLALDSGNSLPRRHASETPILP